MITYLLRFIWALIFQMLWNTFTILGLLFLVMFDIKTFKEELKNDKDFWIYFLYYKNITNYDWYLFKETGEWKSIFHWAFKIQKH